MRTTNVNGYRIQWDCILFGKRYFFAIDVEDTYYMIKVNSDGSFDIL